MMVRQSGFSAAASGLPAWNILFAREPESDLDLDEMDDQGGTADTGLSPDDPEKPSGRRPLLWGLFIVVAAAGGYLAMNPDLLMDMLGEGTPAVSVSTPPPAAPAKRAAAPPASSASTPPSPSTTPEASVMPRPAPARSTAAMPPAAQPGLSSPAPTPSPSQSAQPSPAPAPPALAIPSPLFSEGQRVTVVPDPTLPAAAVSLNANAARTKPGPRVSPAAVLMVVDGEFQDHVWVYAVRTPQGTTGWVAEKQLKAATR